MEEIWLQLKYNNSYNIDKVALVLAHMRHLLEQKNSSVNVWDVLKRYNGFNETAEKYADVTYKYYLAFQQYNLSQQTKKGIYNERGVSM